MNTMIEIYDRIMGVVEEVTGISKDKILTSNCEECVDARHILVYILGNRSFSDNKIAELTGLTVGETLESAANVKCNGNVHGYNLLTPVTIAFATAAEAASVAVAKK